MLAFGESNGQHSSVRLDHPTGRGQHGYYAKIGRRWPHCVIAPTWAGAKIPSAWWDCSRHLSIGSGAAATKQEEVRSGQTQAPLTNNTLPTLAHGRRFYFGAHSVGHSLTVDLRNIMFVDRALELKVPQDQDETARPTPAAHTYFITGQFSNAFRLRTRSMAKQISSISARHKRQRPDCSH